MDLQVGDKAPNFILKNTRGEDINLSEIKDDYKVLLLFFPLAFTGTCTEELCRTRDNMKIYDELDVKVLAVSVDSFHTLKQFKRSENLNFTLLSDFNKEVSAQYGALYDDFYGMMGVSKRAAFVISEEGTITYAEVLEDAGKLPNYEEIHKTLQN